MPNPLARRGWSLFPLAVLLCLGGVAGASRAQAADGGLVTAQRGVPGRPVQYGLALVNGDRVDHSYALHVKGLPGEAGVFLRDGTAVSRVILKPGAEADLMLQVTPPGGRQGQAAPVRGRGGPGGRPYIRPSLELRVDRAAVLQVAGTVSRLTALSGKEVEFLVTVVNRGELAAQAVKLTTAPPPKWRGAVSPASVATLGPGQSVEFWVKLTIPPTQDAGNQQVQVAAEAGGGVATGPVTVQVVVQKGTNYLLLPVILVAASALGTIAYFRRHGRR